MSGISVFLRITRELASLWGIKKSMVCNPQKGSLQNLARLATWSQTSCLQNCEKYISVVYKPTYLWYFVLASWTYWDSTLRQYFLFPLSLLPCPSSSFLQPRKMKNDNLQNNNDDKKQPMIDGIEIHRVKTKWRNLVSWRQQNGIRE